MMIRSITGDVAPAVVALALPHTHVLHRIVDVASTSAVSVPSAASSDSVSSIRNEDLRELRATPTALGGRNLVLEKEDEAFRELELLGGLLASGDGVVTAAPTVTAPNARPLVVDVTIPAEGRDEFMAKRVRIAEKLSMHFVTVTTCEVANAAFLIGLPASEHSERLAKGLETDLMFGFHADSPASATGASPSAMPRVCAGAIYQQVHSASDGMMRERDSIVAHAIALAQQRTRAPVYLSFSLDAPTPRDASKALQQEAAHRQVIRSWLNALLEHGADCTKLIVCHADQWCEETCIDSSSNSMEVESNHSFLQSLLQLGVCLLFSMIGLAAVSDAVMINPCIAGVPDASTVLAPLAHEPPRDSSLARCIAQLIRERAAHIEQLLLSSSVQQRIQYARLGGNGYTHVFTHFRQRLLQHGVTPSQFEQLVRANPVRVLSWYVPPARADVPKDYLKCSICGADFEPIVGEYFTKFAFTYCGTKCLRRHSRQGFATLPLPSSTTTAKKAPTQA